MVSGSCRAHRSLLSAQMKILLKDAAKGGHQERMQHQSFRDVYESSEFCLFHTKQKAVHLMILYVCNSIKDFLHYDLHAEILQINYKP